MDDGCKNGMAVGGMEKVVIRHAQLAADSGSPFPFRFFFLSFPRRLLSNFHLSFQFRRYFMLLRLISCCH